MDNNIINTKNIWEIPERTGQFTNRYPLMLNGHKVIVLEHYTEAHKKINKNIEDALNNYDSLLEALKEVDNYWKSGNFSRKPELWDKIKEAIKKAEQ